MRKTNPDIMCISARPTVQTQMKLAAKYHGAASVSEYLRSLVMHDIANNDELRRIATAEMRTKLAALDAVLSNA